MFALPAGLGAAKPAATVAAWQRFNPTGAEQTFVVPPGFTSCTAYAIGGAGGGGVYALNGGNSGAGGYSEGTFSVTPGETLRIRAGAGGQGGHRDVVTAHYGGVGGYPGGGSGSFGDTFGGGGGGYSGVFRNAGTALVIAGGGGGGSGFSNAAGAGGGATGGVGNGAGGGSQSAGGTGTWPGTALQGGNADNGNRTAFTSNDGGGGGGGYFGGGAMSGDGRSGGGGSGFIGVGVTGNTYAGTNNTRPAQVPATINGESTAGLGVGVAGIASVAGATAANGGAGRVWLHFT